MVNCVCVKMCVSVQWDRIKLQCLWKSIMCAVCFYELIKATFEAKQGEMKEGERTVEKQEGAEGIKKRE